jgi:DNA-binding NarL/FixJ family response regulator
MRSCLIVDADGATRAAIARAIRAAGKGVEVLETTDVEGALALASRADVAFVDLRWGMEPLRALLARRPDLHVVALAEAGGAQPDVVAAIGAGALAVVRKPVQDDEVARVLDSISPEAPRMDYFG